MIRCVKTGLLAWMFCLALSFSAYAESLHSVLLVRPDDGKIEFWSALVSATKEACTQFDCKLETQNAEWDQYKMVDRLEQRLKTDPKPDVVLFPSVKRNGPKILALLAQYKVKGFIIDAGLSSDQLAETGKPREKNAFWIGQMLPNNVRAGRLTAELLIEQAKKKGLAKDGKVRLFAVEGLKADDASVQRVAGLQEAIAAHPEAELLQIVPGNWDPEHSDVVTQTLMRRYTNAVAIWTASSSMAKGAIKAVKASGKTLGKDLLVSGIDWAPDEFEWVKSGELEGSGGGHVLQGAWAIVAVYDYFKSIDFAQKEGVTLSTEMSLLTSDNLGRFQPLFGAANWSSIDFKKYSKAMNPGVDKYTFDSITLVK